MSELTRDEMMKDDSTTGDIRTCKHGQLQRQCEICEAIRERDEALEDVRVAEASVASLMADLRDRFAMAALTGLIIADARTVYDDDVDAAYIYADAMMARRKR